MLESLVEQIPADSALCIYHTHVANQMPKEVKEEFLCKIEKIAESREVYHLYNNVNDKYLHLDYFLDGAESKNIIAETDGHARWFRWLKMKRLRRIVEKGKEWF